VRTPFLFFNIPEQEEDRVELNTDAPVLAVPQVSKEALSPDVLHQKTKLGRKSMSKLRNPSNFHAVNANGVTVRDKSI
jgi:hypothetical protein